MPKQLTKRNRLSDMDYDEISLVDAGANQHAHVVLTKRDGAVETHEVLDISKRVTEGDKPSGSMKSRADRHRARVSAGKKKGKESQRARNFREEKYNRVPKGNAAGGQFDDKGGGGGSGGGGGGGGSSASSKDSKGSSKSSATKEKKTKQSAEQKAREAARKKAEKRAATRKKNQDATKVREAIENGTAIVHGSVSQEMWEDLLDKGWKGKPGDKKEALYPPSKKSKGVTRRLVPSPTGIGYQWETVKKGIAMPKTVVEKRKGTRACGECGDELAADATVCEEHPDARIKKSVVIVRKEESDEDDALTPEELAAVDAASEEEDEEDEDDDVDDEDDDDLDDDDDEEDDDEEDDDAAPLAKSDLPAVTIEALGAGVTLAENIAKAFSGENPGDAYEAAMSEFNHVMDAAAEQWLAGSTVSKSSGEGALTAIQNHINNVVKSLTEGTAMPKPTRPQVLDTLDLPEDVKNYLTALENGDVSKSDEQEDIYKGLTPQAAEIVRKSAEVIERDTAKEFSDLAKSYTHVPGDKDELAKALRTAKETSPEAFAVLKKSLDAAQYNMSQGDIFKSHGLPGGGEPSDEVSKRQTAAQKLVEEGKFKTVEEAEAHLLDESGGRAYVATQ